MKLVDKMKKLKGSLYLRSSKELTEDKGEAPEEHTVVDEESNRVVATFVKKDGKILESSATQDAQDSGSFEDATKKVGGKKDDIKYTSPSMAAAKAFVDEKTESKDKKNERVLGEKAKLVKAVQSPGSAQDVFPKSHAALELDGDLKNPDVAKHHMSLHQKHASMAKDEASRKYHQDQASKIYSSLGLNKSSCSSSLARMKSLLRGQEDLHKDLNYGEINKIETQKAPHTIDYSKFKAPAQVPRWKQRREEQLRQQRQGMMDKLKTPVKKPLGKSEEPLQKDVKSLDAFRQRYQKLKEKTSKPGMTRDEKIKAALTAQADTNPFATQRQGTGIAPREDRGPVDEKFREAVKRQANKDIPSKQEDREERAYEAKRTLAERGIEKRQRDEERQGEPIFEQVHGAEALKDHKAHSDLSRGGKKVDFRVIDNKRIAYHGSEGDSHYFSVSGRYGTRPHRFAVRKDEKGKLDIRHIPQAPIIWEGADPAEIAIEYGNRMKSSEANKGVAPAKAVLKKHPLFAPAPAAPSVEKKISLAEEEEGRKAESKRIEDQESKAGLSHAEKIEASKTRMNDLIRELKNMKPEKSHLKVVKSLEKAVHPRPGLGITKIHELMRRWKRGRADGLR